MKVVLTGSLGRISKRLAQNLLQKGYKVTVISSNAEKQSAIENMGAKAAIGSMLDVDFLTKTFEGADIVYLMEPPFDFFNHEINTDELWLSIAHNYAQAINASGVNKVIHLSSIGAHASEGVGMLNAHHFVENVLKGLPENVVIKTMRPVGFFYNMFAFVPAIKHTGSIISNYGGDEKEPWVSPNDIADTIAEEMDLPFSTRSVRYIASDEVSPNELAQLLGEAIGVSDLSWKVVSDEERLQSLLAIGMNPRSAKGLVEMDASRREGTLYADFDQNKPELGKHKIKDFAIEFAKAFHAQ